MNLINRIMPSRCVARDPAQVRCELPSISPVTLERLKLISSVRKSIDSKRAVGTTLTCPKPKHLGIIVPYRNREAHLKEFIPHMQAFLGRAGIEHTIVIAEQIDALPFNRAALINIGALAHWDACDHFCFHDVDLLPLEARYLAYSQPLKNVRTIREADGGESTLFNHNFGGVTSVSKAHLQQTNGMSNRYWGWGREDDDFLMRCLFQGLHPCKDDAGLYQALPHPPSLTLNARGQQMSPEEIAAQGLRRKHARKRYGQLKRGFLPDPDDGLTGIQSNFEICEVSAGVRRIRADLSQCLTDQATQPLSR